MKPCVVGIGGAGGKILEQFLKSQDVDLVVHRFGEYLAFGDVKGVWLESSIHDAQNQKFYGNLIDRCYPPYLICHDDVSASSITKKYVEDEYGLDLKAMGYDRRAEYVKAMFEIFEQDNLERDLDLKEKCSKEFNLKNPLSRYMWEEGVRPFTTLADKSRKDTSKADRKAQESKEEHSSRIPSIPRDLAKMVRFGSKKELGFSRACDSILFLASLGGGTGTGFINPITSFVRSEDAAFLIFALGILTEKGVDEKDTPEEQRDLGAVIAIYDLLTKEQGKGIDGLLLMDNQILRERAGNNKSEWDRIIDEAMKPLLDSRDYPGEKDQAEVRGIQRTFWETDIETVLDKKDRNHEIRLLPPMFVPCYHTQPDTTKGGIKTLVDRALGEAGNLFPLGKDGRLFPCDPTKADRALVFTRGFFSDEEIAEAVARRTKLTYTKKEGKIEGKIRIIRKLGDSKNEDILILLRNPYGGCPGEHKRQGTLEWRLHEIISLAQNYIDENEKNILSTQSYKDITKEKLWNYFYGEKGLSWELYNCIDRLENGVRPVFQKPLFIFGNGKETSAGTGEICKTDSEVSVEDKLKIRELVKAELKEILRSDDCRRRIKEILQS